MLTIPLIVATLELNQLPVMFVAAKDPQLEDPYFHLSGIFNISVNGNTALLTVENTDGTFATWTVTNLVALNHALLDAMIYHRDVLNDHTYDQLIRPRKAVCERR